MSTTFSDCGYFPGGRVVKPGYKSCLSKYGTWYFNTCLGTYQYVSQYIVYKVGDPKPASCA